MIKMERTFFQHALNTSHCFLNTLFSGVCCTLLRLCSQVAKCPGVIKANDSEAAATCHSDHVMHCFPYVSHMFPIYTRGWFAQHGDVKLFRKSKPP